MPSDTPYDGSDLISWLGTRPLTEFPSGGNYHTRLSLLRSELERTVYGNIAVGALIRSIITGEAPVILNDHSLQHVDMLIKRAQDIMVDSGLQLTPYELYIFLAAAHIHDVANIIGREGHEQNVAEVLDSLNNMLGVEDIEKREIIKIASAHGGVVGGNRDTIQAREIEKEPSILNFPVRAQLISALVRFCDEIADDYSRASRFFRENQMLAGSQAFHEYSISLKSVNIVNNRIKIEFEYVKSLALNKVQKLDEEVYLLDEIFSRLIKMYKEWLYCSIFWRNEIYINAIVGRIRVFDNFSSRNFVSSPLKEIPFEIKETGYPDHLDNCHITQLCSIINVESGDALAQELGNGDGDS
jgi:hypothetical protein